MKTLVLLGTVAALLALGRPAAAGGGLSVSVVGEDYWDRGCAPPVVYQPYPPPVAYYYPPPVYWAAPPVYYAAPPVYPPHVVVSGRLGWSRPFGWGGGFRSRW